MDTLKKTKTRITRYKSDEYYVDIVDDGKALSAWLQNENYGISDFMLSISKAKLNEYKVKKGMVDYDIEAIFLNCVESRLSVEKKNYMYHHECDEESMFV